MSHVNRQTHKCKGLSFYAYSINVPIEKLHKFTTISNRCSGNILNKNKGDLFSRTEKNLNYDKHNFIFIFTKSCPSKKDWSYLQDVLKFSHISTYSMGLINCNNASTNIVK